MESINDGAFKSCIIRTNPLVQHTPNIVPSGHIGPWDTRHRPDLRQPIRGQGSIAGLDRQNLCGGQVRGYLGCYLAQFFSRTRFGKYIRWIGGQGVSPYEQ